MEAQTQNTDFVENGFTSRMDFLSVRYSVTSLGLLSKSQLHLQGSIVSGSQSVQCRFVSEFEPVWRRGGIPPP
jgi:hypothetical protein